ncbi:MAG TPA: hypothetical protein VJO33_05080 [Gemmatimonadaceae bacterium]|nr:hypothetical protein [Gemmatimonadaceae bacterium]
MRQLETVLATAHEECKILERNGHVAQAQALARLLNDIETATIDYRKWLTEGECALRSGKSEAWFRARFPQWLAQGLAGHDPLKPKVRCYRQIVVPMRANVEAAREEARQAALRVTEKAS